MSFKNGTKPVSRRPSVRFGTRLAARRGMTPHIRARGEPTPWRSCLSRCQEPLRTGPYDQLSDQVRARPFPCWRLRRTLLCVSSGVAMADPLPVADVTQSADTDDGWHLSAALTRMTINSVPNMAATAFTREGFVTGKAAATIDGNGAVAVNSGTLVLGLQLGCQIDLSEGGSVRRRRRHRDQPQLRGRRSAERPRPLRGSGRRRLDQPAARDHHQRRPRQEGAQGAHRRDRRARRARQGGRVRRCGRRSASSPRR